MSEQRIASTGGKATAWRRPRRWLALLAAPLTLSCQPATNMTQAARPAVEGAYQPYFGDLHVHTALSADAFVFSARTSLEDAYRFAQGEEITLFDGRSAKIRRPLDFVAMTDHSESFGEYYICTTPSHPRYDLEWCRRARAGDTSAWADFSISGDNGFRTKASGVCESDADCREEANAVWRRIRDAAESHNHPGKFTAFVGFEFSPSIKGGGMLHRNVVFRGATLPDHALSATEAATELDLWEWLDRTCQGDCRAITIPHNMNFSRGYTFARETTAGKSYAERDRQRQLRIERLVEIAQVKGYSECVSGIGLTDEECGMESVVPSCEEDDSGVCVPYGGDARTGLALGLRDARDGKINSLRPGFVGSSDNHNGLAGNTSEDNFRGAVGLLDNSPGKRLIERVEDWRDAPEPQAQEFWRKTNVKPFLRNPGGLAGVWATYNSREALFEAFEKGRTFATSGNRMAVRFITGEKVNGSAIERAFATGGERRSGMPMGATLDGAGLSQLQLAIEAYADPLGPGLHEVQIVKAWSDLDGKEHFRVYSVYCNGKGSLSADLGACSSEDVQPDRNCGTAEGGKRHLHLNWRDPEFVTGAPAYYYVRVFQRPTCRWTTHQALAAGLPIPKSVPRTIRERAWASPVYID